MSSSASPDRVGGSGTPSARVGRKRDASRDGAILGAALEVLVERGYEGLTMDLVAARAQAGKATVYRRWPSKAHMLVDAVEQLGRHGVDIDDLPDTGTVRGDLTALIRPESLDGSKRELKIIAAVASMHASVDDPELTHRASTASTAPWVTANRMILQRAVDRDEISPGTDVELTSRLLPAMCVFRDSIEQVPLTPEFIVSVIDSLLLPILGVDR